MLLILFSLLGLVITTRLWKWYDSIINFFSLTIRVLDIITWGIVLWFVIKQTWFNQFIYTWCAITIIGFMIIGFIRLFIKRELFYK